MIQSTCSTLIQTSEIKWVEEQHKPNYVMCIVKSQSAYKIEHGKFCVKGLEYLLN